jgi:hypothetical protein
MIIPKKCMAVWAAKHIRREWGQFYMGALPPIPLGLTLESHPDGPKKRPRYKKHGPSVLAPATVLGSLPSVALSPEQAFKRIAEKLVHNNHFGRRGKKLDTNRKK